MWFLSRDGRECGGFGRAPATISNSMVQLGFRVSLAGLYLLATAHLATRWIYDGVVGERWVAALEWPTRVSTGR